MLTIHYIDDSSETSLRRVELLGSILRESKAIEFERESRGPIQSSTQAFSSVASWHQQVAADRPEGLWIVFLHAPNTADWHRVALELATYDRGARLLVTFTGGSRTALDCGSFTSSEVEWWRHFSEAYDLGDLLAREVPKHEAPYLVDASSIPVRLVLEELLGKPLDTLGELSKAPLTASTRAEHDFSHEISNAIVPVLLLIESAETRQTDFALLQAQFGEAFADLGSRLSSLKGAPKWIYAKAKKLQASVGAALDVRAFREVLFEAHVVLRGILATILGSQRSSRPIVDLHDVTKELFPDAKPRLLWIEDDKTWLRALLYPLESTGFEVTFVSEPSELAACVRNVDDFDVFLVDLGLSGFGEEVSSLAGELVLEEANVDDPEGLTLVRYIRRTASPRKALIVLSADDSPRSIHRASLAGADGYYAKSRADFVELATLLATSVARRRAATRESVVPNNPTLILSGAEDPLSSVVSLLQRVASRDKDGPILLIGEPGTGKELLAKEAHLASARASGPFVTFDCPAYPSDLVEAHLFGYKKGAFTGATSDFEGVLDQARSGTLFLDEVDKLPLQTQNKLLGVLSRRTFRKLGGSTDLDMDCLIVGASNSDPRQDETTFAPAMSRRLTRFPITVPSLRQRADACVDLAEGLLRRIALTEYELPPVSFDQAATHWIENRARAGEFDGRAGNVGGLESLLYRVLAIREVTGSPVSARELENSLRAPVLEPEDPGDAFSTVGRELGLFLLSSPGIRLRQCEHWVRAAVYRFLISDKRLPKSEVASIVGTTPSGLSNDLRRLRDIGVLPPDV